jgi:hypothetical protein
MFLGSGLLGLFVLLPISGLLAGVYLAVRLNSRR